MIPARGREGTPGGPRTRAQRAPPGRQAARGGGRFAPNPAQAASERSVRRARDRAGWRRRGRCARRRGGPGSGRGPRSVAAPGRGRRRADLRQRPGPRAAWTARGPAFTFPAAGQLRADERARGRSGQGTAGNRVRSLTGTSSEAVRRRCPGAWAGAPGLQRPEAVRSRPSLRALPAQDGSARGPLVTYTARAGLHV